jgi:hypothetical protein
MRLVRLLVPVLLTMCLAAQQGTVLHVRGHITDATTRKDVVGVSVSAIEARHSATTDTNGFFSLELRDGVKPGDEVRIHIEKKGYRADDVTEAASDNVTYPIQISRRSQLLPRPQKNQTPKYDRAHLLVVNVRLWANMPVSEAMVTVRNIGSKPIVPCALLTGAIIVSPWLTGSDSENQLFVPRPEWNWGQRLLNCDTDWNPGVEKTYAIKAVAVDTPDDWVSLMRGEKLWYVVSRLEYRDSDTGPALPTIENCVNFRAEKPEWVMDKCFGHNDPTLNVKWISGSGREGTAPAETEGPTK